MPTCGYPIDTGPCQRSVHDEDARCFMHDETGTPPGHGAPRGNQNAVGNAGGGAPYGNTNARKYGAWSDPLKEYSRLDEPAHRHISELVRDAIERSKADLSDEEVRIKAKRLAMLTMMYGWGWAYADDDDGDGLVVLREHELEDGGRVVTPILNPAIEGDFRNESKAYKLWEELRLFPTQDGRPVASRD